MVLVYNERKFCKVIYAKETPPIIYKLEYHACSQTSKENNDNSLSPKTQTLVQNFALNLTSCYFISNLN